MKPFKNLDEQLDILTDRGLIITNRERTRKYLLSNNYYNIINGYSKFFQQNGTDDYIDGVTFDEVASLYTFDKDIKRAVLQSILEAEHHIKSIVAHRFAEAYENKKYAYLDTQSYDNNKILEVGDIISKFSKIIKNKKNKKITYDFILDYLLFTKLRIDKKSLLINDQQTLFKWFIKLDRIIGIGYIIRILF